MDVWSVQIGLPKWGESSPIASAAHDRASGQAEGNAKRNGWWAGLGSWVMALFLSTFEKQIDKKGRVSVPPSFRAVLAAQQFNGMIAYASFVHPCIEACGMERIEKLNARIEALDPFSEERDAFATAILGGSVQLAFDGEGRVVIPEALLAKASITDMGIFVGKGATFEIWSPAQFAKQEAAMRDLALKRRLSLKADGGGAA